MEYFKIDFRIIKIVLGLAIAISLYFYLSYRPITYPSIQYINTDSPYLSPEGWPLPYPYVPNVGN